MPRPSVSSLSLYPLRFRDRFAELVSENGRFLFCRQRGINHPRVRFGTLHEIRGCDRMTW